MPTKKLKIKVINYLIQGIVTKYIPITYNSISHIPH